MYSLSTAEKLGDKVGILLCLVQTKRIMPPNI